MATATNVAAYAGSALPREERDAIRAEAAALIEDHEFESSLHIGGMEQGLARFVIDRVPALLDALDAAEVENEWLRAVTAAQPYETERELAVAYDEATAMRVTAETERDAARAEAATLRTQYRDLATYRTAHANLGLCPEGPDDEARDPDCPVCRVLVAHESGIRGRERAAFAALLDTEDDEE